MKTSDDDIEIDYSRGVQRGVFSSSHSHIEKSLNLHELVVKKPAATFFMRAKDHSMIDAGIFPNDLLVIDRSITAKSGHIIVASLNGELTLKRLSYRLGNPVLIPENKKYQAVSITNEHDFQIFGVLTYNLHHHL